MLVYYVNYLLSGMVLNVVVVLVDVLRDSDARRRT